MTAPLDPARLRWRCDPASLPAGGTADLADLEGVIGQDRAMEAIRFGVRHRRPGYNLFLLGPAGVGKRETVCRTLRDIAASQPTASDWCYVHNFEEGHRPRVLRLPAGKGTRLRADMARLIETLRSVIPSAFESEDYRTRRQMIEDELREHQENALVEVQAAARERNVALIRTPVGFAFAPMRDGQVVAPEAFQAFPKEERERIEADILGLQKRLQDAMEAMPRWVKETRDKLRQLNRETTLFVVGALIADLRASYAELEAVTHYLAHVQEDVIEHAEVFLRPQDGPAADAAMAMAGRGIAARYAVNLLVGHGEGAPAPIVLEEHPSFDKLLGKIEHRAEMGALVTDLTLIQGGALHRANGGYLVLDARRLLLEPFAWDGLKRALRAGEVRIESLGQRMSLISTVSLEPEPIPLDLKVVLLGDRQLYYLLAEYDPDFDELFRVAADFDERIERTPENGLLYARLIAGLGRSKGLRPLDQAALARVAEYGVRQAGDVLRLSINIQGLDDLLSEADYLAGEAAAATIGAVHIAAAEAARLRRHDRLRERMLEETLRGTVLIDTAGAAVGQINGLSVIGVGGVHFGRPSRITARVRLGRGEVVDIEREVKLGGPLHTKGVLILAGYLGARFAADTPLSLAATLVFEQSYGGVDGDSASAAELCALLSAIAGVAIRQSLAMTGSVDQNGRIQAIGGVNEKIEGFFDLCAARGLSGEQGVIIPASNVKHLMLHERVVAAAAAGAFRVYPVATIDEALGLLTGIEPGTADGAGRFPPDSVNGRVQARLAELARARRDFGASADRKNGP